MGKKHALARDHNCVLPRLKTQSYATRSGTFWNAKLCYPLSCLAHGTSREIDLAAKPFLVREMHVSSPLLGYEVTLRMGRSYRPKSKQYVVTAL